MPRALVSDGLGTASIQKLVCPCTIVFISVSTGYLPPSTGDSDEVQIIGFCQSATTLYHPSVFLFRPIKTTSRAVPMMTIALYDMPSFLFGLICEVGRVINAG